MASAGSHEATVGGLLAWRQRRFVLGAAAAAALVIPSSAGAEVVSRDGAGGPVRVIAADGEASTLTVSFDDSTTLRLSDDTAPLVAGDGCDGGGPPGSAVICTVSASPSSAFYLIARLGDGNDSIDSTGGEQPGVGPLQTDIDGGPGGDTILTGPGLDEVVLGTGDDEVATGGGDDFLRTGSVVRDGDDMIDGESGNDEMSYAGRAQDLFLGLDGTANGARGEEDYLLGIETLEGGEGDDLIVGSHEPDDLYGGNGADRMLGGDGDDYLIDGPKDFFTSTTTDDDQLFGGSGSDLMGGTSGDDRVRGEWGDDVFVGGGSGNDLVAGGPGRDQLAGASGADELIAGDSDDDLNGGAGDDTVRGGPGEDHVNGGFDSDRIKGGDGDDFLISSFSPVGEVEFHKPDKATDGVGCGKGEDRAWVERRDRIGEACERVEIGR